MPDPPGHQPEAEAGSQHLSNVLRPVTAPRRFAAAGPRSAADDLVELIETLDRGVHERDGVYVHPPRPRGPDVGEVGGDHARRPRGGVVGRTACSGLLELVDSGAGLGNPGRPR